MAREQVAPERVASLAEDLNVALGFALLEQGGNLPTISPQAALVGMTGVALAAGTVLAPQAAMATETLHAATGGEQVRAVQPHHPAAHHEHAGKSQSSMQVVRLHPGDNPWRVAVSHGISLHTLYKDNPKLSNRDARHLPVGYPLYVPVEQTPHHVAHRVSATWVPRPGDTLGREAVHTGTTVAQWQAANPKSIKDVNLIYAGAAYNRPPAAHVAPAPHHPATAPQHHASRTPEVTAAPAHYQRITNIPRLAPEDRAAIAKATAPTPVELAKQQTHALSKALTTSYGHYFSKHQELPKVMEHVPHSRPVRDTVQGAIVQYINWAVKHPHFFKSKADQQAMATNLITVQNAINNPNATVNMIKQGAGTPALKELLHPNDPTLKALQAKNLQTLFPNGNSYGYSPEAQQLISSTVANLQALAADKDPHMAKVVQSALAAPPAAPAAPVEAAPAAVPSPPTPAAPAPGTTPITTAPSPDVPAPPIAPSTPPAPETPFPASTGDLVPGMVPAPASPPDTQAPAEAPASPSDPNTGMPPWAVNPNPGNTEAAPPAVSDVPPSTPDNTPPTTTETAPPPPADPATPPPPPAAPSLLVPGSTDPVTPADAHTQLHISPNSIVTRTIIAPPPPPPPLLPPAQPSSPDQLSDQQDAVIRSLGLSSDREEFLRQLVAATRQVMADGVRVNPEVMDAQAVLESGWGQSSLAEQYHNYFGMKAGSDWTGPVVNLPTQEQDANGNVTTVNAPFRVYPSFADSLRDYARMIQSKPWFQDASAHSGSVDGYLAGLLNQLAADGHIAIPQGQPGSYAYATDQDYAAKIKDQINALNLNKLDAGFGPDRPHASAHAARAEASATGFQAPDLYPGLSAPTTPYQFRQNLVQVATTEVNKDIVEQPLNCDAGNPSTPGSCGPEIDKYTGHIREWWCADAASWMIMAAGYDGLGHQPSVAKMHNWFTANQEYHDKNDGYTPQPGDVVFFGGFDHVGIVTAVDGDQITTVEGNSTIGDDSPNGHGDAQHTYNYRTDGWVAGFGTIVNLNN